MLQYYKTERFNEVNKLNMKITRKFTGVNFELLKREKAQ